MTKSTTLTLTTISLAFQVRDCNVFSNTLAANDVRGIHISLSVCAAGYDGGDCCACTCLPGEFSCPAFDCVDPAVDCADHYYSGSLYGSDTVTTGDQFANGFGHMEKCMWALAKRRVISPPPDLPT